MAPRQKACPDRPTLRRLMLGQLPAEEADRLEEHVLGCPQCGRVLATIEAEDTLVKAASTHVAASEDVEEERVKSLIERLYEVLESSSSACSSQQTSPLGAELGEFMDPPEEADELGRIGPYRVRRVLGSGGMGVVLEAVDPQLQRTVALKVMKPSQAASGSARKRFLREARAAAAIEHDHVVTIHQVGEHRGTPYLAMQLLQGETLGARLRRDGKLPPAEAVAIARQIASGLAAAHQQGVVHRDIKPENIWLEPADSGGRVKILDFGLARVADADVRLTQLGTVAGTPAYMSPEQALGNPVDHRTDLFSLGCVLYEMCTGRAPFVGPGTMATLRAIERHHPAPPHKLVPEVPRPLSHLVMRLLAKDPARRVQSAAQVVEALDRVGMGQAAGRRARRKLLVGLATAAAAVLVLAAAVFYLRTGEGTLVVRLNEPDASVSVDGQQVKIASGGEEILVTVPAGSHTMQVAKEGFSTETRRFEVRRGGRLTMSVELKPEEEIVPAQTFEGHQDSVRCVAFSHDGRRALSGSADKTVRLWDVKTGKQVGLFKGHTAVVRCVAFSPDDRRALSASDDGTVRLWDVGSGQEVRRFEGHEGEVWCAAFSPDGTRVLSGGRDGTVRLWDAETARQLEKLAAHTSWVRSVAFSPDGRLGISGGNDDLVLVWDLGKGRLRRVLQGHRDVVGSVRFLDAGRLALSSSWDGTVRLWDVEHERELRIFRQEDQVDCRAVALVPNSDRLLVGTKQGGLRLWSLRSGRRLSGHVGARSNIRTVAVSPDGRWALASSTEDNVLRLWRVPRAGADSGAALTAQSLKPDPVWTTPEAEKRKRPSLHEVGRLTGHTGSVQCVAFSADGRRALSGSDDATVRLWDVKGRRELARLEGHTDGVLSVAFCPDQTHAISSGKDGTIRLWDLETQKQVREFDGHRGWVPSAVVSIDGTQILSGSFDRTVRLWDLQTGRTVKTLQGHVAWVRAVAFLPDGRHAVSAGNEGNIMLWDLGSGEKVGCLGRAFSALAVSSLAVSPDGRYLAAGFFDRQVEVWDLRMLRRVLWLEGHWGPVQGLAFTPDDRYLLSGSWDNTPRLWDLQAAHTAAFLVGHTDRVHAVAISPDGRLALTAGADKTLRLWALPPPAEGASGLQPHPAAQPKE